MTDEQLALAHQAGDRHAGGILVDRYGSYLRVLAAPFFDATGDFDDLLQEARFGAVKAMRDWRPEGGASFKSFLVICVTRHVIAYVKTTNTKRNRMLTYSLREAVNEDGDLDSVVELLAAARTDPVEIIYGRDRFAVVVAVLRDQLSDLERDCAVLFFIEGASYQEIAGRRSVSEKAIDNALARVRAKLRVALDLPQASSFRRAA